MPLTIDFGTIEEFDDTQQLFNYVELGKVEFEYSLKALYEWEGLHQKPFKPEEMSTDEFIEFCAIMSNGKVKAEHITFDMVRQISEYISSPSTATRFNTAVGQNGSKVTKVKTYTSEEIYALMSQHNIPIEFENRNLNRLFTILKIIDIANKPPEKMSREDIIRQNAELNRQRREAMKTKG